MTAKWLHKPLHFQTCRTEPRDSAQGVASPLCSTLEAPFYPEEAALSHSPKSISHYTPALLQQVTRSDSLPFIRRRLEYLPYFPDNLL